MPRPLRVTVAGGGFAAAELLLALRDLAEERVELEIIAPDARLPFRPAATGAAFGDGDVEVYDLAALARDVGATFRSDVVEAVASHARRARLASGGVAAYDALVLAVGARPRVGVPGALTYRDQRDVARFAALLEDVRGGAVERLAFAAPAGVTWTLPLYELALLTAAEIAEGDVDIALVTPEREPLEVFGRSVSALVWALLAERGIRLITGSRAVSAGRGELEIAYRGPMPADRVVAVPRLVGRRVSGVPGDWNGFVRTDAHGRVEGVADVYAAGDMTCFPVKQGGLATQQADVIAAELARRAGAGIPAGDVRHVLRAAVLGAGGPLFLRAELDGEGRPLTGGSEPLAGGDPMWWPAAKVFGRYLTPWMAARRGAQAAA